METEHPLKIYRVKNKLTQGQLAQILGVSDATITHIENGRRPVTPKNALDWERKIGLTKEALCPDIFGREIVGAGDTAPESHQATV